LKHLYSQLCLYCHELVGSSFHVRTTSLLRCPNVEMTVTIFFGYLFLSCGPPLAAGLPFFWHRSFLSLTVVTSMFAWLALLIFISALFRAFVPVQDTAVGYLPLILVSVIIEECVRIGFWHMHKIAGKHLKHLADTASVRYSSLDELALAYSVGWGHGATHMLFQFGPFLPLTWYTATAYSTRCTDLSLFMVSVLNQLGIFGVLAGVMILAHIPGTQTASLGTGRDAFTNECHPSAEFAVITVRSRVIGCCLPVPLSQQKCEQFREGCMLIGHSALRSFLRPIYLEKLLSSAYSFCHTT
jgi:gamma-secretase subunit APH-1